MAWFPFVKRRQPGPGAMAFGLDSFRAAAFCPWGPATRTMAAYRVTQPPQSAQGLNVPVDGLGGLTAGQIVGQPLFDLETQGIATPDIFEG
ncbi:MAG: hypothetical protein P4N59_13125 [Negativicutes bacterium]|nr:hypothetical protein [Negativicutes bacterium]